VRIFLPLVDRRLTRAPIRTGEVTREFQAPTIQEATRRTIEIAERVGMH